MKYDVRMLCAYSYMNVRIVYGSTAARHGHRLRDDDRLSSDRQLGIYVSTSLSLFFLFFFFLFLVLFFTRRPQHDAASCRRNTLWRLVNTPELLL